MMVGVSSIKPNKAHQIRFQAHASSAQGAQSATSTVASGDKDKAVIQRMDLKQALAPELQKRWDRMSSADRRMTAFILKDIEDYAAYAQQNPVWRFISRFFIGLFQPWRKKPAFASLRENLMKQLPPADRWSGQHQNQRQLFDNVFHNNLVGLQQRLQQVQSRTSADDDRQLLLNSLLMASVAKKMPVGNSTLYSALFDQFAQFDVEPITDAKNANLKQYLQEASYVFQFTVEQTMQAMAAHGIPAAGGPTGMGGPGQNGSVVVNPFNFVLSWKNGMPVIQMQPPAVMPLNPGEGPEGGGQNRVLADAPEYLHPDVVDRIKQQNLMSVHPAPTFMVGDVRDQRDVLVELAQKDKLQGRTHALVVQSTEDRRFHQQWDSVPTSTYDVLQVGISPFPGQKPQNQEDVLQEVKQKIQYLQSVASKQGRNQVLFLIGKTELNNTLSELPGLLAKNPNVKVVVAGMDELPMTVEAQARNQMDVVAVPKPSLSEAVMGFQLAPAAHKEKIVALYRRYKVTFNPNALERMVKLLADNAGGQVPGFDATLNRMEKIAAWARKQADVQQAEAIQQKLEQAEQNKVKLDPAQLKATEALLEVTPQMVEAFEAEFQKALKPYLGAAATADSTFDTSSMKFEYVKGYDKLIGKLQHATRLLKTYSLLKDLKQKHAVNIQIPKLLIFSGPSGTGKSMMAEAIAGEAGVKFLRVSAAELIDKYVGSTAEAVKDLYKTASQNQPCVIFLDEVDAIASKRNGSTDGGKEIENGLNQLLVELNQAEGREGVITIVATNRQDLLDTAFVNRRDMMYEFKLPSAKVREEILKVHAKLSGYPFAADVNFAELAKNDHTEDWSGRRLEKLIANTVRTASEQVSALLEEAAKQANPDLATVAQKLPEINQAMLLKEVSRMRKEEESEESKRPGMGFHTIHAARTDKPTDEDD